LRGKHFYATIDQDGRVQLPSEWLDELEDAVHPVGMRVFVYVKLAEE